MTLLLISIILVPTARAANIVVTPGNLQGWAAANVRANATVGITPTEPRSGLGSLEFTTNTITAGQDKADFQIVWNPVNFPTRTLANLSALNYEFFRDSTSTTGAQYHPVLRILWYFDNATPVNLADDRLGLLIWEGIYQIPALNPIPTNTWLFQDALNQRFWMFITGGGVVQNYTSTLANWLAGTPVGQPGDPIPPNFALPNSTTYVYGINVGVGSGWGATFQGFVDNVTYGFGGLSDTYNFEPFTAPVFSKQFLTDPLALNSTGTLRFTIANNNPALSFTGIAFTDTLPANVSLVSFVAAQCGGTLTSSGPQNVTFTGGLVGASANCAIDVTVRAVAQGTTVNTSSGLSTTQTGLLAGVVAVDDITVTALPGGGAGNSSDENTPSISEAITCENLGRMSDGAMTARGTIGNVRQGDSFGNVYCRIINQDGHFVTSASEIGHLSLLQMGTISNAVDLFGLLADGVPVVPFINPVRVCLRGSGTVYFLNAAEASRTAQQLPVISAGEGATCVDVPISGTVILISGDTQAVFPASSALVASPLAGCQVRTTHTVRLRAAPDTASAILTHVPFDLTLTATERVNGWFKVIFMDMQGWISADYLTTIGNCGV